ncbi:uncharacterized protein [Elaeis guineensis]|uniref:Uncharacterized protein LOC105045777 n=1 Tax=Elaeis guineensis var. tenera TaxID=51953 RepID=A0A6I9R8V9_ELAGV|nr:uncharacterized protein LOC105045777 [Elaeis guineensis]
MSAPPWRWKRPHPAITQRSPPRPRREERRASRVRPVLALADASTVKDDKKPAVRAADELHHAPVPGTEWKLALMRYTPSTEAPLRSHPLMLLSGVGTNAIGFDLSSGMCCIW